MQWKEVSKTLFCFVRKICVWRSYSVFRTTYLSSVFIFKIKHILFVLANSICMYFLISILAIGLPFPHSTSVRASNSIIARLGWTFSQICFIFVHPKLETTVSWNAGKVYSPADPLRLSSLVLDYILLWRLPQTTVML